MPLRPQRLPCVLAALAVSIMGACGADLGTPDYSDQVGLREPINPFPPVPPDPYDPGDPADPGDPGDERLSVGYFYEGGRSVTIEINTVTTDYFIFALDVDRPVATRSFAESISTDRVEGLTSYEVTLNGSPFWGGGIIWFQPFDLSEWTTMFVSFKSSDPSFARFDITLQSGAGEEPAGVNLDPTAYGYSNDGEWHFLQIPLQDAIDRGWDPLTTRSPFIVSAPGGEEGDVLLIDNLYFTKD